MFPPNLVKYLSRRAGASMGCIIQPLTDAFLGVGLGSNIE